VSWYTEPCPKSLVPRGLRGIVQQPVIPLLNLINVFGVESELFFNLIQFLPIPT